MLIESLQTKLESNNTTDLSKPEIALERQYYSKFYDYIISLPRPVVGIYYAEEHRCDILCADHFDNALYFNTQIDLKSISQNSPIRGLVEGGGSIYATIKEEVRKDELHKLNIRKAELEIEKLEKTNALLEREYHIKEIEFLNGVLEAKLKADALVKSEENRGIKAMTNSYAQRQLVDAYQKNQIGYSDVMNRNQFVESAITVIDTVV